MNINLPVDILWNSFHVQTSALKVSSVILKILSHWKTSAQKLHLIMSSSLQKIIYHTLMSLHTEVILSNNQKFRTLEGNHKTAVQIKFLGNWLPFYLYSCFNTCTEISDSPNYLEGSDHCKVPFNMVVAKMNQF